MAGRKPISNKIRFEVFKRDSFKCQYCGKSAPEIILEIDHIQPVIKGGENDLMNLITSCFDCNRGKRDTLISDFSAIQKQQKILEELNEKRVQLEMLLQWRNELKNLEELQVSTLKEYIEKNIRGFSVVESYKREIKKWLKKYDQGIIYEAIDEAASRYLDYNGDYATKESVNVYLEKIPGIIFFKSLPPIDQKINWIKSIAAKVYDKPGWRFDDTLKRYSQTLKVAGFNDDEILLDLQKEVRPLINTCYSASSFLETLDSWTEDIKK